MTSSQLRAAEVAKKDPESKKQWLRQHFELMEFTCGWGAASINILLTFPLNKLMFRQQLYGIDTKAALRQLYADGKYRLYRGMLPPLIMKTTCLSVMFGMYDGYQRILMVHFPSAPVLVHKGTAALLAGCTEAILLPLERIQTLLQSRHYHRHFNNTIHAFRELWSFGIAEYYRGLTPVLMRNGPSNALFFLLRGKAKDLFPNAESQSTDMLYNFVSGGLLGATISTMFFPVNVVKTHMQSQIGGGFVSFREAFYAVFNERNRCWRAMFRGIHINYIRSLLSWGIINASYELLKSLLFQTRVS
ncbi:hypothetical protein LSH36_138g07002 [Paralvinella palmiformis]|uniref:Solute carrier family 25 member 51 n=1 Tax=Paralvinella palmiformis TaxID=53620 RepID=A0AAD9JVU7_9ANNE|nr:hypothetical protein LSH36_138g07002 [Paralvinella palmiformis]